MGVDLFILPLKLMLNATNKYEDVCLAQQPKAPLYRSHPRFLFRCMFLLRGQLLTPVAPPKNAYNTSAKPSCTENSSMFVGIASWVDVILKSFIASNIGVGTGASGCAHNGSIKLLLKLTCPPLCLLSSSFEFCILFQPCLFSSL
jgi:hypothetical protein